MANLNVVKTPNPGQAETATDARELNDLEGKARAKIAQATTFGNIINSTEWKEGFAAFKQGIIQQWDETNPDDTKARENLWVMNKTIDGIQEYFEALTHGGVSAQKTLQAVAKKRKWFKNFRK